MKTRKCVHVAAALLAAFSSTGEVSETASIRPPEDGGWSPTALVTSPEERTLFIACAGTRWVLACGLRQKLIRSTRS